jgi:O-methyltransferase
MPAAGEQDDEYSRALQGKFVGSEAVTRRILRRVGAPPERFEIVTGWFAETLARVGAASIALLHVDCDFYDPVKLVLDTFYDRVEPGGYVVLNDYGSFQGCRTATDEFLARLPSKPALMQIDRDAYYFERPLEVRPADRPKPCGHAHLDAASACALGRRDEDAPFPGPVHSALARTVREGANENG